MEKPKSAGRTLISCVDGSQTAKDTLEIVVHEFTSKQAKVIAFHVSDQRKKNLPEQFTKAGILDSCNNFLLSNVPQFNSNPASNR